MEDLWTQIVDFLSSPTASAWLRAIIKIIGGFALARFVSKVLVRRLTGPDETQLTILLRRTSFVLIFGLFLASGLAELGFQIGVLLGAAGILTVAVGFASQTSASNVISGLFLLGERAFEVGDILRIDTTTGVVLSIDLLSVKLRTFDNLFVRIPNENLIKSQFTNLSRFPIRRVDISVGVAYKEDIGRVTDVLMRIADQNPLVLDEPKPLLLFLGYGESSLDFQFSVWAVRTNWLDVSYAVRREIKESFDREGIEIPFPHRSLYTGSVTEPFPVQIVHPQAYADPTLAPK
jgi:small-conductance mechanosensitive channel